MLNSLCKRTLSRVLPVLVNSSSGSRLLSTPPNAEWTKILARAEKVVGYPTSFLSLRYLVSDEIANVANLLRKLIKTKHPLLKMARHLVSLPSASSSSSSSSASSHGSDESKSPFQFNGLIVLLISKAAGIPATTRTSVLMDSVDDGIHRSQRSLAEIAEMIYMGSLIHKGIVDASQFDSVELATNMDQGNKIAVLCGDYLLASACRNLSKLQNTEVVVLMSQVIADISQSIFIKNSSNMSLNAKLSLIKLWYDTANSDSSSLLANSAKASLLLVKHSPKIQEAAANFARNLDLAYKIWSDLIDFKKDCNYTINKSESIVNAIYKDKYEHANETENDQQQQVQRVQQKAKATATVAESGVRSSSQQVHKASFFSSTFYPLNFFLGSKSDSRPQQQRQLIVDDVLYDRIFADCKLLFDNHYRLAIDSLTALENESSAREAISSLRSMLNVMNSTV